MSIVEIQQPPKAHPNQSDNHGKRVNKKYTNHKSIVTKSMTSYSTSSLKSMMFYMGKKYLLKLCYTFVFCSQMEMCK